MIELREAYGYNRTPETRYRQEIQVIERECDCQDMKDLIEWGVYVLAFLLALDILVSITRH
jgi:hypothetical protein